MAEDQGVNGDVWNEHAIKLLKLFNWHQIGDTNMDLLGSDEGKYGVDGLMLCNDPSFNVSQPIIIESKRYAKESLSLSAFKGWIDRLKVKINKCKNSSHLLKKFDKLNECGPINQGVIMCWVHNADSDIIKEIHNYFSLYEETSGPSSEWQRIGFLTNDRILELCSLAKVVQENNLIFCYPSQIIGNRPVCYKNVLTMDYMFSDVILATTNDHKSKVVFYFGDMDSANMNLLRSCLLQFQYLISDESLTIYYYHQDEEFRKIKNDIIDKLKFPT